MPSKFFTYVKYISDIGLLLLVFLLPWQTRWIASLGMINGNPSEYLTISLYATDILLMVLIVDMLICAYAGNNIFRNFQFSIFNFQSISNFKFSNFKTVVFLAFFFIAWGAASILWASDKILAGQRIFWLLLAVGFAWLVVKYENKFRLFFWFIMGLTISAWLGIWQFFAQYAFANKWLGLATHSVNDPGTSYLEIAGGARWLRSYASFDHPNVFGFAMALGILLILWMIYNNKNTKYKNAFLYLVLASLSAGLFTSLSRSAFLGLFFGLVIIIARAGFLKIWKPLVILLFVFGILTLAYPKPLLARSDISARLEQKSINERELYFQQGAEIIKQNSILGVGVGNYISGLENEDSSKPAWTYQPVHNYFLLIWAELGIFAMLAAVGMVIVLALYAWKKGAFYFAVVAFFVPTLLVDHWLWDLHFGILLLGFILGIVMGKKEMSL